MSVWWIVYSWLGLMTYLYISEQYYKKSEFWINGKEYTLYVAWGYGDKHIQYYKHYLYQPDPYARQDLVDEYYNALKEIDEHKKGKKK